MIERAWTSKLKYVWGIYLCAVGAAFLGFFWLTIDGWRFVLALAGHPLRSTVAFQAIGCCSFFLGWQSCRYVSRTRWPESLAASWRIRVGEASIIVTGIAGRLEIPWMDVIATGAGPNGSIEILCVPWGRVRIPLHGYFRRERAEIREAIEERSRASIISTSAGKGQSSFASDEMRECWYDSDTADAVMRMVDGRVLRVKISDASIEQQAAMMASADARLDATPSARTLVRRPRRGNSMDRRTRVSARAELAGLCVSEVRRSWGRRGTSSAEE